MINAICDDIAYATDPHALLTGVLNLCSFPSTLAKPDFGSIQRATIIVEQGFSDFGDLDLLILLDHPGKRRQAILLEAKVTTDISSWERIADRWAAFIDRLDGNDDDKSNLFVQLYRKLRLIRQVSDLHVELTEDDVARRWSLGENRVIRRAAQRLKRYCENPWYVALLPDDEPEVARLFNNDIRNFPSAKYRLPDWDTSRWGFLTWENLRQFCQHERGEWRRTLRNFHYNRGQIFYVAGAPDDGGADNVRSKQVYRWDGQEVYVTTSRRGDRRCRVVPTTVSAGYFPESVAVAKSKLEPIDPPPPLVNLGDLQPRQGGVYLWDPPQGKRRQPPKGPSVPITAANMKVTKAGWKTSAVVQLDATGQHVGGEFHVYNHHIRLSQYRSQASGV